MKSARSYSDHEIAHYVLGLDLPEQAQAIQARLAQDDVAAARALKWETCLLSIVDALPPAHPPDELLVRIQISLGMENMPVVGDVRAGATVAGAASPLAGDPAKRRRRRRTGSRLNRGRLALVTAAVVLACVAALVIWASLRPTTSRTVQEAVQLEAR